MKIGLIGFGYWGGGFVARNLARVAELAVIVDPDPSRMVSASEAWAPWGIRVASEPEVAFETCDAVWIATPVQTHADLVERALTAGCHVMCEKPFVLRSDEAETLVEQASDKGLVVMAGHLSLYTGAHRAAVARAGRNQDKDQVNVVRHTDRPSIADRSVTWGLGPHDIAALVELYGEPEHVTWTGNDHRAALYLEFAHAKATVGLDWLAVARRRVFAVNGHDCAQEADVFEPLFQEASTFVDLCKRSTFAEAKKQAWLIQQVTSILERSEVEAWL